MSLTFESPEELAGLEAAYKELQEMNLIDDVKHMMSCCLEGVPVLLSYREMGPIAALGLVSGLEKLPGRGRYANRYRFIYNHEETVKWIKEREK